MVQVLPVRFRPVICYDASAINRLKDDPDSAILLTLIKQRYFSRITSTNIEEIVETENTQRRWELREHIRQLGVSPSSSDCIKPFHFIVDELIKLHIANPETDWKTADIHFPEGMRFLQVKTFMSDADAAKQRAEVRRLETDFRTRFHPLRKIFEEHFRNGVRRPANFAELVSRLQVDEGGFWTIADVIYHDVTKQHLYWSATKTLVEKYPPLKAIALAVCMAQYELCIRNLSVGPSYRAGRFDLLSAVYLCYCDIFVSAEVRGRQYNALKEISETGQLRAKVLNYGDFRRRLFPFSTFSTRSSSA